MRRISIHIILPALAILLIVSPGWGQERKPKKERTSRIAPSFDPTELLRRISYPESAWREKIEGEVRIQVLVDDVGTPVNTSIGTSVHPTFAEQVRKAVMETTFRPAMKDGKPTVEWVVITVRFDLHGAKRQPRVAIMKAHGKPAAERLEAPVASAGDRKIVLDKPIQVDEGTRLRPDSVRVRIRHKPESDRISVQNNSLMDDIMLESKTPPEQKTPPAGYKVPYYSSGEIPEYDDAELQARLKYPEEAKAQNIEGMVVVRAFVDEHGGVIKAEIGKSDNPLLDDAARAAVLETRFMPVRRDGKATAVWVEVPVKFRLSK